MGPSRHERPVRLLERQSRQAVLEEREIQLRRSIVPHLHREPSLRPWSRVTQIVSNAVDGPAVGIGDVDARFVQCEGSAGPVDLFASGQANGGFLHTHLLAQLSVAARAVKGKATISARDAGDPVAGATITVGGKHVETDAHGLATLALRPGSYSAAATAAGYAPASVRFTVR